MAETAIPSFHGIIGRSPAMRALFGEIERFAPVDVPVLIRGESGTGKELIARAIQRLSTRRRQRFATLNCADLTRDLLRSELFGHERGAFTGAVSRERGLVADLDGGTLFMDEVGELAPDAQAMLLRFLQDGEGRPVGATANMKVDVRMITATHRDLEAAVDHGAFREDVYYRLSWVVLEVPPLRDRRGDIPLLVEHFRREANSRYVLAIEAIAPKTLAMLESDPWRGNVRELEAVVKRAMIRRRVGTVVPEDLVLPRLHRQSRKVGRVPAVEAELTPAQKRALELAYIHGEVRRRDVIASCGISREAARRALLALIRAGVIRRQGSGRATRYVPTLPAH